MRPDHACSVARLLSRVIVPAALAQALLFAWRSAASRLPVVFGAAADERFHDLASVALALAAVALGLAVGRSAPRLRRSIAAAMVGSIALLPFLHSTLLRWLSALVLALWKDEADRLIHPTDLYRLDLPDAQALASMLPLVGLASVAVVALLRWAPVRRVLVGGVLGAVAVAVAAGLAHGVAARAPCIGPTRCR